MNYRVQRYDLGVNFAYHESSVCLMADGRIIAALEEERFNRYRHAKPATIKQSDEFPFASVEACLKIAGITMHDVAGIGCSFLPETRYEKNKQLGNPLTSAEGWGTADGERQFRDRLLSVPGKVSEHFKIDLDDRWRWFSHHLCHVAGAYAQSGFSDAALLCADGIGEFNSTVFGAAKGNQFETIGTLHYPNSLGLLWEKFSTFLGFTEYDATKVMSLAAFGNPKPYRNQIAALLIADGELFSVDENIAELRCADFTELQRHFSLDPIKAGNTKTQDHLNLVAALQEQTENILLNLVNHLGTKVKSKNLCYTGGVALNCIANQKICRSTKFDQVFIQPAANDAGTAVGAAYMLACEHLQPELKNGSSGHAVYLGTEYSSSAIQQALEAAEIEYTIPDQLSEEIATLLSQGNVIGWFQGRMEFGPRALGNRSILADPRSITVRERIDTTIKFRESFRPYAPSVLAEYAESWFDIPSRFLQASQYMLVATMVLQEQAKLIPGVIHKDDSSRIHLVDSHANPRYHALINSFYHQTGVPMLLNTSFNSQGPIVETPHQALVTFQTTEMDVLVLGDYMVKKQHV